MDNYGAVVEEVVLRTTVRTRLRLNATTKNSLWSLRQQQREFCNTGVEIGLFARNNGESIPSNYTAHTSVLSSVRKDKTHRRARQNLTLQRSGMNAGLESVRKWSKHREAGTKRLFARRHEEESCSGAALVYGERASLITTERGVAVKLPGGLVLPLRDKGFTLPEGHSFTGAVQVVDVTDTKGKVTRRTLPEHRTYNIHLSFRSDGVSHSMPDEKVMQKAIKGAQRRRARCKEGSRRWRKYNREVAALSRAKTNRRQNERNHIAKDIATTNHVAVSVEDLKAKSMSSTAKGTVEHPGTRVAQKRGLNRSLQQVGVRAMLDAIERSCRKNGKDFFGVPPHYTSQTCSLCGEIGKRERQAFACTSCGARFQADFNASCNVRKVAYLILMLMAEAK